MQIEGDKVSLTSSEAHWMQTATSSSIFKLYNVAQRIFDARRAFAVQYIVADELPAVNIAEIRKDFSARQSLGHLVAKLCQVEMSYGVDSQGVEQHIITFPMSKQEQKAVLGVARITYDLAQNDTTNFTESVAEAEAFTQDAALYFITSDVMPAEAALEMYELLSNPNFASSMHEIRFEEALGELSITGGIIRAFEENTA